MNLSKDLLCMAHTWAEPVFSVHMSLDRRLTHPVHFYFAAQLCSPLSGEFDQVLEEDLFWDHVRQ